jgi:AcrR family transcriptional regulator
VSSEVAAGPRAPGRPRDPARGDAILEATLQLLGEEGFARLSMEAVAHRAGVGKPTIYRRWATKTALVVDALDQLSAEVAIPTEGSVRERLTSVLTDMLANLRRGRRGQVMVALVAEIPRDRELAEAVRSVFLRKRQGTVFRLLQEGVDRGELPPDLDLELAADLLIGPVILRRLLTGGPLGPELGARIVDYLFDGWAPRPGIEPTED